MGLHDNWGRFARPPPLKKYFCGCVAQKVANEFLGWVVQCCACAAGSQQNENIVRNLPQNRRKTCPEAPGRSQEHDGSNRWTFCSIFFSFEKWPDRHYDFHLFWLKNWWKMRSKTLSKNGSLPKLLFSAFLWFFGCRAHDFNWFWVPTWAPGEPWDEYFCIVIFWSDFCSIFVKEKKRATPKK